MSDYERFVISRNDSEGEDFGVASFGTIEEARAYVQEHDVDSHSGFAFASHSIFDCEERKWVS